MTANPVDIHIHLTDEEYSSVLPYLKAYIKTTGMTLVSVSVDFETSLKSIKLAEESPGMIIPFIGVHPQMAEKTNINSLQRFINQQKDSTVGFGEIGLDRRLDSTDDISVSQRTVFKVQLEAAEKLCKPVSIHSRGTLTEILETLPSYRLRGVLLHWFAGNVKELSDATSRGYYASFGPALVYSKGKKRLAASMPSEYILTETDGPVHFGSCFNGHTALPAFLPSVLFALSSALNMSYDDTVTLIQGNSEKYLQHALLKTAQ
jgi:TatD DNase family protein